MIVLPNPRRVGGLTGGPPRSRHFISKPSSSSRASSIDSVPLESDSEPTLVAVVKPRIDTWLFADAINTVASALEQDCIAVYKPSTGKGALIGPRSYKWGTFSPEYFFMPDGSRLGGGAQAA